MAVLVAAASSGLVSVGAVARGGSQSTAITPTSTAVATPMERFIVRLLWWGFEARRARIQCRLGSGAESILIPGPHLPVLIPGTPLGVAGSPPAVPAPCGVLTPCPPLRLG